MSAAAPPAGYAHREVTKPPDWHGLVVWDLFFNAVTTGLFLAAAVAELLRPDLFATTTRWVYPAALAVLVVDLLCLVMDLGDPLKFHHMLRVFRPSSPMSFGTWSLTAYSAPLTAVVAADLGTLLGLWPGDSETLYFGRRAVLAVGLVPAFCAMLYKGVLFSTSAQPGWRDARWLGAYHAASAVTIGACGLFVEVTLTRPWLAADALWPAVVALAVLQLLPLSWLLAEMRPAFVRAHGVVWFNTLAAGAALTTLAGAVQVAVGGWGVFTGVGLVAAAALWVRSAVVRLPHAGH